MDGASLSGYGARGSVQLPGPEMADGEAVKDLNHLLRISGESYPGNAKQIDEVMIF
jgi:hypothetical protein